MASLKDTVALTTQLTELTNQLHGELTDGDVDFEKMVQIADEISEHADSLASAFARVNEALAEPLEQENNGSSARGRTSAGSDDDGDGEKPATRTSSSGSTSQRRGSSRTRATARRAKSAASS